MQGGVIRFRGTGADALRYVECDRSRADDYYLNDSTGVQYAVIDSAGETVIARELSAAEYSGWVDWVNPDSGEAMGKPRLAGPDREGSPRFLELVINSPKSLSIAAALHPEVSDALDVAQQDALVEIRRWLGQHSVTRVGPRGRQEVVPIEQIQVAGIPHRTSRAGDPHRHIHMQIGARAKAAGAWRALDTRALLKQQYAIRALGTAVINAHPLLADVLGRHGLTLDLVTGEVAELEPFKTVMSKRGVQVNRHLDQLEEAWKADHPGETMGPVISARLRAKAWAYERPAKKPTTLCEEAAWRDELREAGYGPERLTKRVVQSPVASAELSVQAIASRALDRCAANASAWNRHDVQNHVTHIITEAGLRATPAEVRELVTVATQLALEDCFSTLPDDAPTPEHVAHLTTIRVVQVETELRDLLTKRAPAEEQPHPDLRKVAAELGQDLDSGQLEAAAAIASTDPLVIVEGAAGAGKTTMLATAIAAADERGFRVRVVAPTKRAAEVAREELGITTDSVAALVHAHGYRWNNDGVWTRLGVGQIDPETGAAFNGPPQAARLQPGERVVVDEAGMLDQDTALALLTVAAEARASIALVGDRAQLPAVGRGGVLDMAAEILGRTVDMAEVHRFTDPEYAEVTVQMRERRNLGRVFDRLQELGLVQLHADANKAYERLATHRQDGDAVTVASNEEATQLNDFIRVGRIRQGLVDDTVTATGNDGLNIGRGDLIQTRKNRSDLGVANRQQWIVQRVEPDGSLWARDAVNHRKREHSIHLPADYVREHTHLSYAATAYGVQGVTAPASHTVLSEQMSSASIYVGMTRGRTNNTLHIVAENLAGARQQFIDAMARDRADRGLADATQRAAAEVHGLVKDGPTARVNQAITNLINQAERAEARLERWKRIAAVVHATEGDRGDAMLRACAREFGVEHVRPRAETYRRANPDKESKLAARAAAHAREEAMHLKSLTPAEAVERIEAAQRAEDARSRRIRVARTLVEQQKHTQSTRPGTPTGRIL